MRYMIGIDPGKGGAMAVYDRLIGEFGLFDFPLDKTVTKTRIRGQKTKTGKPKYKRNVRTATDYEGLAKLVLPYKGDAIVMMEEVNSHNQGKKSAFSFGGNVAAWRATFACYDISVRLVVPQVWKAKLNLIGKQKKDSIDLAKILFPCVADCMTRAKDDGRAEALLLIHYGMLVDIGFATADDKLAVA